MEALLELLAAMTAMGLGGRSAKSTLTGSIGASRVVSVPAGRSVAAAGCAAGGVVDGGGVTGGGLTTTGGITGGGVTTGGGPGSGATGAGLTSTPWLAAATAYAVPSFTSKLTDRTPATGVALVFP